MLLLIQDIKIPIYLFSDTLFYPVLPNIGPLGMKGMFRKRDFVYDDYFDCYLCPKNQPLLVSNITHSGYRTYKSNSKFYISYPLLETCTINRKHQKVVDRHIWVVYGRSGAPTAYGGEKNLQKKKSSH